MESSTTEEGATPGLPDDRCRASARVAVGLGSNVGDRAGHLRRAVDALGEILGGLRRSGMYETRPEGIASPGQRPFLNMCCVGHTTLEPGALLGRLHGIEADAGRRRPDAAGAPRTLDLDLLLYDEVTLEDRHVTVPHPRMSRRAFVLVPLAEIAPGWRHPVEDRTVEALAAEADASGVRRWDGEEP